MKTSFRFLLALTAFAFILSSCGSRDKDVVDFSKLKDIAENLPSGERWSKEIQDKNLIYKINSNIFEGQNQVSIMMAKDGQVETATSFQSVPLIRFAKANLSGREYAEIVLIGQRVNQPDKETIMIWAIVDGQLSTILLPAIPGPLLDGINGKEYYSVKPPYIEKRMMFNDDKGGEYSKSFFFRIEQNGEAKLHAVDNDLVQEIAF
jgi:hypothetical protein